MKKTFLIFFLFSSFILPSFSAFAEEEPAESFSTQPTVSAEAAVLIDAATGEILYEKNSSNKMYPASITKLMTMLLAFENGNLEDTLTFSHEAVYSIEPGSAHIAMQEGEQITLQQALYAIQLRSANEVSNAVAEYIDGSVEAFAKRMTERAKELGCENTNFLNANGLFDENHYTTAHDMALIAQALLKQEGYRKMMSETYYEIPITNLQTEVRFLHGQHQMLNSNSLYYYEYATGGKTGFTSEALNTLVTYAKKDDTELIAVVLKCNGAEHYVDTKALFDYGFANYKTAKLFSASDYTKSVTVTETYRNKTTELGTITAMPDGDFLKTVALGTDLSVLDISVDCPETISAPITKGQSIGTVTVSANGSVLGTTDLKAQSGIAATTEEERAAQNKEARKILLKKIGIALASLVAILALLFCVTRTIGYYKRQQRRKRRAEQRKRRLRKR